MEREVVSRPSDGWEPVPEQYHTPLIKDTLSKIRFDELEARASLLKNGAPCTINRNKFALGGRNVVFEAEFEDHTIWIVRVRLVDEISRQLDCDRSMESEVVTLNFVKRHTSKIPVPAVYGYDSGFQNAVGSPYMFMEAMNGRRLIGGGLKDFIPDEHKAKIYQQISEFILALSLHPFEKIGMLQLGGDGKETIGDIVNAEGISFGPFSSSIEYYWHRNKMLSKHDGRLLPEGEVVININRLRLLTVPLLVTEGYERGPYFLTHPDFGISNMLFDKDFNITALLDWSGTQTSPIASFARPPCMIVPQPLKSRPFPLSEQEISRREMFFRIFRVCETANTEHRNRTLISPFQSSYQSIIAGILDDETILGHPLSVHVSDLLAFVFGDDGRIERLLEMVKDELR